MKKQVYYLIIELLFVSGLTHKVEAQVVSINMDAFMATRTSSMTVKLIDKETGDPLAFASVYLQPVKDTIITNFALTDKEGNVNITDISNGRYKITAEYVGYKTFTKEHLFSNGRDLQLGTIKMEQDAKALEAAKISAIGNAITISKDTITYNASSFKVGSNAMLKDLLRRMPGIEVDQKGGVKVNGEAVSRITVGGKTFFFDNTGTAVNNLPAKIVEKVKVIDKTKKEAENSGMVTVNDKEKVMDLELKEEYKKGWFGNVMAGGGAELNSGSSNPLRSNNHGIYTGNLLAAGYNENDNLTLLANATNSSKNNAIMVMYSDDIDLSNIDIGNAGINTSAQAGANFNTSRIKGFETTATVNYKHNENDQKSISERNAFQKDQNDLITKSNKQGINLTNSVSAGFEIKKTDTKKYSLRFEPKFNYSRNNSTSNSESNSSESGIEQNSSLSSNQSKSNKFAATGALNFSKNFNKKHYITLNGNYNFSNDIGDSHVFNEIKTFGGTQIKDLLYDNNGRSSSASIDMRYTAQLAKKLKLKASYIYRFNNTYSNRDAFNIDGKANDYYTSWSRSNYAHHKILTTLQHNFKGADYYNLGLSVLTSKNETYARSLGVTTETGINDWRWELAPEAQLHVNKGSSRFNLSLNSAASRPGNTQLMQALDITNPTQITTGNIYLKPFVRNNFIANYAWSNKEKFSFASVSFNGQLTANPVTNASWYDNSGIRYFIPVNTRKPTAYAVIYGTFNQPLGKERKSTLSAYLNLSYISNSSYQSLKRQAGIDQDAFDYNSFMQGFWGNADGDIFYSGKSGFTESTTTQFSQTMSLTYSLNLNSFQYSSAILVTHNGSRYSINPESETNTWDITLGMDFKYETESQWEFSTSPNYKFYRGYMQGYASPRFLWDINVSKNIKNFMISLQVDDLLNQEKGFSRSVNAEYIQDSYSNRIGRTIILKLTYNFGKSNASMSNRVRNASYKMM